MKLFIKLEMTSSLFLLDIRSRKTPLLPKYRMHIGNTFFGLLKKIFYVTSTRDHAYFSVSKGHFHVCDVWQCNMTNISNILTLNSNGRAKVNFNTLGLLMWPCGWRPYSQCFHQHFFNSSSSRSSCSASDLAFYNCSGESPEWCQMAHMLWPPTHLWISNEIPGIWHGAVPDLAIVAIWGVTQQLDSLLLCLTLLSVILYTSI